MFPRQILRYETSGAGVMPLYLDARHAEIVRSLLGLYERHDGSPSRDLERAVRKAAQLSSHDARLLRGLSAVIEESVRREVSSPIPPHAIRRAVFEIAAAMEEPDPRLAFRLAGEKLGLPEAGIESHLYADLEPERRVRLRVPMPGVEEILSRYNFRLVQGLVFLADRVVVASDGQFRAMYRLAKLHGLIVEVKRAEMCAGGHGGDPVLEITGPVSLFKFTRRYGRALGAFLPACTLGSRYRIEARLNLQGRRLPLVLTQADGVLSPHREPRRFDSRIEERFFQDFVALGSRWEIAREGDLIPVGDTMFIPDFTFSLRSDPCCRVHLEIIGFWTRDYLARKQALIRRMDPGRIVFCVDSKLCCDRHGWRLPFLSFSGRIDPGGVLDALERTARAQGSLRASRSPGGGVCAGEDGASMSPG